MSPVSQTELPIQSQAETKPNNPKIMGLVAEVEPNISSVEAQAHDRPQDVYRTPISQLVAINPVRTEAVASPNSSEVFAYAQYNKAVLRARDYVAGMDKAA